MATRFRLQELLAAQGLTQTDVQLKTGLAYSTINELYNNKARRVDLNTLDVLCAILGCTVGDVIEYVPGKKQGRP